MDNKNDRPNDLVHCKNVKSRFYLALMILFVASIVKQYFGYLGELMSKGFKFSLLGIVCFIIFILGVGSLYKPKLKQDNPDHAESNYDEKVRANCYNLHDAEIDAKQTKESPPVYEPVSLEQTKSL
jgi:cbb3-type cytochrome oxidase subunit 3